jgi:hypothetical protein
MPCVPCRGGRVFELVYPLHGDFAITLVPLAIVEWVVLALVFKV